MAYKVFTNGSTLQASEVNENLMQQAVATFSNAAARTAAITSPVEGQMTYLLDVDRYESWNGAAWVSPFGTTLIASSTFTAQTSVAFDNVFTAQFRYYDFFGSISSTVVQGLQGRLRTGSTDLSTSTYNYQRLFAATSTVGAFNGVNQTVWEFSAVRTTGVNLIKGTISNPFIVGETQAISHNVDRLAGTELGLGGFYNTSSASYNGFRFFVASGTMTGNISIYGRHV